MKKQVKWLAVLACLVICISLFPSAALASGVPAVVDSGSCGDDLWWTLDEDGLLTISGSGDMPDYFTNWDQPWFDLNDDPITSVVIEDGVTGVGALAFYGCRNLKTVSIPDSVTTIGRAAFSGCTALTEFIVSDGNPCFTVKDGVLFDRGLNTLVAYPAGKQDGTYTIPDSVTTIGDGAFVYCRNLLEVTIPESVTVLERNAFAWCESLRSITIPDSVTTIGYAAFERCDDLRSVKLGNGITSIDRAVFSGCRHLKSITIPEGVTSIGGSAFYYCLRLSSIMIPAGVTSIGDNAFDYCESLHDVYYGGTGEEWERIDFGAENDLLCSADIHFGVTEPPTEKTPEDISGPCGGNLTWTLSDDDVLTVSGIGEMEDFPPDGMPWKGFRSEINAVVIESGVTSIGENAFRDCAGLMSATIGDDVTAVGANAFYGCSYLRAITIPDGVTSIGDHAFCNCSSMSELRLGGGLTSIGEGAFTGCWGLTEITLPDSVTTIGGDAFSHCGNLASVTLPDSVTYISENAFRSCLSLTEIRFGSGVTGIGDGAFADCWVLAAITIPACVTSIGEGAFANCTSLADVYFGGSEGDWTNVAIGGDNEPLRSAAMHFNVTEPADADGDGKVTLREAVLLLGGGKPDRMHAALVLQYMIGLRKSL